MKKLLLSSGILLLFSLLIIVFQISCKKEATAQTTNSCSETATVNITVTIPASKTLYLGTRDDNGIFLDTPFDNTSDKLMTNYNFDIRTMGTGHTRTYTFKNVIPKFFNYFASFRKGPSSSTDICGSAVKQINILAGQTYNLTIASREFPCQ